MPMPKPAQDEGKQDFIDRCMGDDTMVSEYPENDQRLAVCYSLWDDKDKDQEQNSADDSKMEVRAFTSELRAEYPEDEPHIRGHAAVFNTLSPAYGGFRERIYPGAFKKSILEDDIRALFNHDPNLPLGRTKSGTLKLQEDDRGLAYDIKPPDTTIAQDLMQSIKRGDVDQSSFAFSVEKETWEDDDDSQIRTIYQAKLYDVSPVTFPYYPTTDSYVRKVDQDISIISKIITGVNRGIKVRKEDRQIIERILSDIDNLYQDAQAGVMGDADSTQVQARLDMLQRRLKIAELLI